MKSKGERETYIQLNTEFQRITRRDKKAFFNEQCIKLEENNRTGKTRDLVRKIGNIQETFLPKMGTIKHRNGRDLVDTEEIKKRWEERMEELYKTYFNELDYYDGMDSHPEPDILECEVKWALASITTNKASGGDRIPGELFDILKDDAMKVRALNMPENLENSARATRLEKVSFHSNPKEGQCRKMLKLPHN